MEIEKIEGKILSGKELSTKIKTEIKEYIDDELLANGWRHPRLVTILVGDNPASKVYVANKEKACKEVGIKNFTDEYPEDVSEEVLADVIEFYNNSAAYDGILVQLPLPKHINTEHILNLIAPEKDVDGFHPDNVAKLWLKENCIVPCTPKGIIELMESNGINLEGKNVVVVGRSNIVGLPVAKLCLDKNATVTIAHSKTKELTKVTQMADILIVAIGKPKFITADMVKEGAVVIDVGINRIDGKLCGDVDFENVQHKTSFITPVPGGVGPMTICELLRNTVRCFQKNIGIEEMGTI